MIFSGKAIQVTLDDSGVAEMCFDLDQSSVNKLDQLTRSEFKQSIELIASTPEIKAVLVTSGKPFFIVGADITEFTKNFEKTAAQLTENLIDINTSIFNKFEDLEIPTVVCLNGMALGGGLELAMSADYRVMASNALVGLPETTLGIIPGYGGTVRLPRLIGLANAIEWITSAKQVKAPVAADLGLVSDIVEPENLRAAGLQLIQQCLNGELDYLADRQKKLKPLSIDANEASTLFKSARQQVLKKVGPHYPAGKIAIDVIEKSISHDRDEAIAIEASTNGWLSKEIVPKNLIGIFMGDQALVHSAKRRAKTVNPVIQSAVLGAGIMGGGIAYQSALKGTPIIMKDINQDGLDLGLAEADKLLSKQISKGRMKPDVKQQVLDNIKLSLDYQGFDKVDMVVEAVVENINVKKAVLAETETHLPTSAVLTSNTSTISINDLATSLERPENFCGMHFFNPVPVMPLVEVIRGDKSSDETVARVCSYALSMGKKPVVVNDCPGFLVNRILSPYFHAFITLIKNGIDHERIDRVMEDFGWPMGPAYLVDVIGIDTLVHGAEVLAEGYPDRMLFDFKTSHEVLYESGRMGQKNGLGYYKYEKDQHGISRKLSDPIIKEQLANYADESIEVTDQEIVALMMLPMCLEAVRCLEDDIVATPVDVDMSLIYAIGFPRFRGGALRYLEAIGFDTALNIAEKYGHLGGLYSVPELLKTKIKNQERFY